LVNFTLDEEVLADEDDEEEEEVLPDIAPARVLTPDAGKIRFAEDIIGDYRGGERRDRKSSRSGAGRDSRGKRRGGGR